MRGCVIACVFVGGSECDMALLLLCQCNLYAVIRIINFCAGSLCNCTQPGVFTCVCRFAFPPVCARVCMLQ